MPAPAVADLVLVRRSPLFDDEAELTSAPDLRVRMLSFSSASLARSGVFGWPALHARQGSAFGLLLAWCVSWRPDFRGP